MNKLKSEKKNIDTMYNQNIKKLHHKINEIVSNIRAVRHRRYHAKASKANNKSVTDMARNVIAISERV